MALDLERFMRNRPYLFHLTSSENVKRIWRCGRLESAARLFDQAGSPERIKIRRPQSEVIDLDGEHVRIRDQYPLHEGNMKLEHGLTFGAFVEVLNRLVFFWPGGANRPISYGVRHYLRYRNESPRPAILRMTLSNVLAANPGMEPLFCKFNSGSPRCSWGKKSPRSKQTFLPARDAAFGVSQVVEVTFPGGIHLPQEVMVGNSPEGPWRRLN